MAGLRAPSRICTVRSDAQPSRAIRKRTNKRYAPRRMLAVFAASDTVREAGAGRAAVGGRVRGCGDCTSAVSASVAEYCTPGVEAAGRMLAIGSKTDATNAATQTIWRWNAGPLRINRQANAAT